MSVPQDHRARRRQATHRRIYDAAMRLFQEHGYEDVTVAHIAAASRVSVPTFYDHFPSKDHLIMAVPTREQLRALVVAQPADLPLGERMRRMVSGFLTDLDPAARADVLARWQIVVATPGLRMRAAEFERTTAQMVLDALDAGAPDGAGPHTFSRVVVTATLSAYTQVLLRWAESGGEESLDAITEDVFAALRQL